jgi:hypothetical protein
MSNLISYANVYLAKINLEPAEGSAFAGARDLTAESMISGFLKLILVIAGVAFFFILVIGGVKWIISGGDKAHTEGARNQITAALVGLVIVFSAWAIVALIQTFFGVNLLNLEFTKF